MRTISPALLALQRLYHWEHTQPGQIALVQPLGQGAVLELTWSQVADQVRRMAAHLQAQAGRAAPRWPSCPKTAPGG